MIRWLPVGIYARMGLMVDQINSLRSASIRAESDKGEGIIDVQFGHWNRWNLVSDWMGTYFEYHHRGSFDESFENQGKSVRFFFEHGKDPAFGKMGLGSYQGYRNTEDGPVASFKMFEEAPSVQNIMPGLRSTPPAYGFSYHMGLFKNVDESWEYDPPVTSWNPQGYALREVFRADVYEITVCNFPQDELTNEDGHINFRSVENAFWGEDKISRMQRSLDKSNNQDLEMLLLQKNRLKYAW